MEIEAAKIIAEAISEAIQNLRAMGLGFAMLYLFVNYKRGFKK